MRGEKAEVAAEATEGNFVGADGNPNDDKASSSHIEVNFERSITSVTTISAYFEKGKNH